MIKENKGSATARSEWVERITWLRDQIAEFDGELLTLSRHSDQFELQLAYMYQRFVREGQAVLGAAVAGPGLSGVDNLDSGNAVLAPPAALMQGLRDMLADPGQLRVYSGPEVVPRLARASAAYWNHFLRPARPAGPAQVVVGAGTVNLWDAVLRQYLRPGDAVAVACPTYGFFLPHVSRAGGFPVGLPTRGGLLTAEQLAAGAREFSAARRKTWIQSGGPQRLWRAAAGPGRPATKPPRAWYRHMYTPDDSPRGVTEHLMFGAAEAGLGLEPDRAASLVAAHGPPRVSLLLHLNPTLNGAVYHAGEVQGLMAVAQSLELLVIEDLSYFPVRVRDIDTASVRDFPVHSISLVGLSKVMGIADLRIGIAMADPPDARNLMRRIENSIGFVPQFVQLAIAGQLASLDSLSAYIVAADAVYESRLNVLMHCLGTAASGRPGARAGQAVHDRASMAARIRSITLRWAARMSGDRDGIAELASGFLAGGLAGYLVLDAFPVAGFFALLDCSGALNAVRAAGLDEIHDSFGLAALLAHLAGVRTIAAQAADADIASAPPLLRISFSVSEETLVASLFYIYVLVSQLTIDQAGPP